MALFSLRLHYSGMLAHTLTAAPAFAFAPGLLPVKVPLLDLPFFEVQWSVAGAAVYAAAMAAAGTVRHARFRAVCCFFFFYAFIFSHFFFVFLLLWVLFVLHVFLF